MIGVFTAIVAVVIDIGTDWLSDIKMGICPSKFWRNQNFCCYLESSMENCSVVSYKNKFINTIFFSILYMFCCVANECDNWYTWQNISHSSHTALQYIVGYIIYVAIGVCIFLHLSHHMVGPCLSLLSIVSWPNFSL